LGRLAKEWNGPKDERRDVGRWNVRLIVAIVYRAFARRAEQSCAENQRVTARRQRRGQRHQHFVAGKGGSKRGRRDDFLGGKWRTERHRVYRLKPHERREDVPRSVGKRQ